MKHITSLNENEVFVFGSNLSGIHGGGAAKTALQWGAVWGQGIGMQGQTYAIPTKSEGIERTLTVDEIRPYVAEFIQVAQDNSNLTFLVTDIGCGLAGHKHEDIAPLFLDAWRLENVVLPEPFKKIRAYYFSDSDRKLRYGDGREIAVGITHEVEGPPVLCEHGLHASLRPIDALQYAPGTICWEVELGGDIVVGNDKVCATKRTYIREIDCSEILPAFARWCALQVIDLWDAPAVVREYLETGDEKLRAAALAAARAAWAAAGDAARDAARDAAWAAALAAARAAARAAWAAAGDAAWDAAGDAARDAARTSQNEQFVKMIQSC